MRILHVDTERTWRGGENQVRLLVEGLLQRGVECHLALRRSGAAAERLKGLAPIVTSGILGSGAPFALRLARYCQNHRITLLDAHTAKAHSLALQIKSLCPEIKLVVHRRVDNPPKSRLLSRRKYLTPKVDAFVAISGAIADELRRFGVPPQRLRVVKSAVDLSPYGRLDRAACRHLLLEQWGIAANRTLIGNASALSPQKGYDVLLAAAASLRQTGSPFQLLIAGAGDCESELRRMATSLNLDHHVTFVGFLGDVRPFLAGLDILAVPSRNEGLGTIILEGIGAGLAVAASRVGGIPEIITDGDTGLLSPPGDPVALATNLQRLVADPGLRAALASRARAHVERAFSLSAMVDGNAQVYQEVLGGP